MWVAHGTRKLDFHVQLIMSVACKNKNPKRKIKIPKNPLASSHPPVTLSTKSVVCHRLPSSSSPLLLPAPPPLPLRTTAARICRAYHRASGGGSAHKDLPDGRSHRGTAIAVITAVPSATRAHRCQPLATPRDACLSSHEVSAVIAR